MYIFYLFTFTLGVQFIASSVKGILKYKHEKELVILYTMTIIASLGLVFISVFAIANMVEA